MVDRISGIRREFRSNFGVLHHVPRAPPTSELGGDGPSHHYSLPTRAPQSFSRPDRKFVSAAELPEWDAEFPRPADLDQRAPERKCPPGERAVSKDLDARGRLWLPRVHARLRAEA
jgi:hypothetical protein